MCFRKPSIGSLSVRDSVPIRGGISLLSANRPTHINRNQSLHYCYNSPPQRVRQVIPVLQIVPTSPIAFYPQLIKQLPVETERVGNICSSYLKTPTKINKTDRKQINRNHEEYDSYIQNNSGQTTIDQTQFYSNNKQNSSQIQFQNELIFSPQKSYLQQFPVSNVQIGQKEINFSQTPTISNQQNQIKIAPTIQKGQNVRQVVSAFTTPIRKREDHLSHDQVQEKIHGSQGKDTKELRETDKCKIFSEEFLEQRERDLKRRIENLELQKDILRDQLKQKDEEILKKQSDLEKKMNTILQQKDENEKKFSSNILQLNQTVQQLSDENNKLQIQLQAQQVFRRC